MINRKLFFQLICATYAFVVLNAILLTVFGYLSYCNDVEVNILDSLQSGRNLLGWRGTLANITRAGIVFQLCCSLPIGFSVARQIIYDSIYNNSTSTTSSAIYDTNSGRSAPRKRRSGKCFHFLLTTMIVGSAVFVALLDLRLEQVLGLLSASAGTWIVYVCPSIVFLAVSRNVAKNNNKKKLNGAFPAFTERVPSRWWQFAAFFILLFGIFLLLVGCYGNLCIQ